MSLFSFSQRFFPLLLLFNQVAVLFLVYKSKKKQSVAKGFDVKKHCSAGKRKTEPIFGRARLGRYR